MTEPGIGAPAEPYQATLQFGTGLIHTPVAWISPRTGAVWLNTSAKEIPFWPDEAEMGVYTRWNTNLAIETHWFGRFSVGASVYSQNPDWGFFGQALLLRDGQFGFLPGVAVGVRNLGPCERQDRLLVGCDITLDANDSTWVKSNAGYTRNFNTAPSFYGVVTKDISLTGPEAAISGASLGLNVGWGNGLFSEDGGLGDAYNESGTIASGLFLGGRFMMHPTLNTALTFMVENDGWDWNAGVVGDFRGITLGFYGTELEEGGGRNEGHPLGLIYNYRKWNVALGYSGNIYDIGRGILLRTRITEMTLEAQRLRYEIAERERRIRGLELALNRARAGELADIARRRQELDREVQEEREAIRRAEERLQQIQETRQPVPPPAGTPPGTPGTP